MKSSAWKITADSQNCDTARQLALAPNSTTRPGDRMVL
jgi:hypothetical protein